MDKANNENFSNVRNYAQKIRDKLSFSSENLLLADNYYVAWLDLMGAGHLMGTSIHKTANFLARLHMAVAESRNKIGFSGSVLAINDGVFLTCSSKEEIMTAVREIMALLAYYFVATPRPHDRFFVRCGIAYGPVYFGKNLTAGILNKEIRELVWTFDQVAFGPPIISAYRHEAKAPPFGVAISESARSFAPPGIAPFRMTHWLWWQNQREMERADGASLPDLKSCLLQELKSQFKWMRETLIFNEVTLDKIKDWEITSEQYFSLS
jgi:hypothetical protein